MCELFGMSSSHPVQVKYSLHAFAQHGGLLHPNKSGWGIAYHKDRDALVIREPEPASDSRVVRFIEAAPIETTCAIAHVRYATAGAPSLANTHPFMRELGGQVHVFAHNGSLDAVRDRAPLQTDRFRPVGETDSEHAFCILLERLAPLWSDAAGRPALKDRLDIFARTSTELADLGCANFLYSDGDVLFLHAHRRVWDEGAGNFSAPRPPGLSVATLNDLRVAGLDVKAPHDATRIAFIASVPLTEAGWEPLPEGTVLALEAGQLAARCST